MDIETNKLPPSLVWIFLFICVTPMLLTLIGVDFSTNRNTLTLDGLLGIKNTNLGDSVHISLAGSFTHTILEWTAFCSALFTAILAFVHFSIKRDITTPIIALALMFSGCMDAFHTLAADRLIESVSDTQNFIPFTWAICRIFNALILIVGILFLSIRGVKEIKADILLIFIMSITFGVIAFMIIHITATSASLPQTQFPDNLITRPYDVVPLLLFLFAGVYIFPKYYNKNPSLFAHALLISAIPEVAVELHMAFGSTALFDNHFNIAHFLKIFAYLVPFAGLALDYVYTSRNEQKVRIDLICTQDELKLEKEKTEETLELRTHQLKGRIKELNCLYNISTLIMRPSITVPKILTEACELILPAMRYPDIAATLITLYDEEYTSSKYKKSKWNLCADMTVAGNLAGQVCVSYLKDVNDKDELPFLKEEKLMVNEIADRIGRCVERMTAQEELKQTHDELMTMQLQLIQAEKMDSIGKLSAGIAHEVKNPLAVIQLGINYIQKKIDNTHEFKNVIDNDVIEDMEHAIYRADSVIKELVDFSASRKLKLETQELNLLIEESLLLVKHELLKHNVKVINNLADDLPWVEIDRNKLQQVFINIFMNAIHAMDASDNQATLKVRTHTGILKEELHKHKLSSTGQIKLSNNIVVVEVEDTGTGIELDNANKIFEPFFTTKKAGVGTGLGLTVTENIIRLHDAFIDIKNREQGGVIVTIMLRAT